MLGVDELNPKKLLEELDNENNKSAKTDQLNTIEDLPGFLKSSKLSDEELMEVLSRFLLQDDINLKQYGAVYDRTGFDGIPEIKELPLIEEQRLAIRAKSSAIVYIQNKLKIQEVKFVGLEKAFNENIDNWAVYKTMFSNDHSENIFIKVCLPLDESIVALCSDKDEPCYFKAQEAEKIRKSNEDYLNQIHSHYFLGRNVSAKKKKIIKTNQVGVNINSQVMNNGFNNQNLYQQPILNNQINNNINSNTNLGYPIVNTLNNNMNNNLNNLISSSPSPNNQNNNVLNYKFKQIPNQSQFNYNNGMGAMGGVSPNGYGDIAENLAMKNNLSNNISQNPGAIASSYRELNNNEDLNSLSKEQLIGLVRHLKGGMVNNAQQNQNIAFQPAVPSNSNTNMNNNFVSQPNYQNFSNYSQQSIPNNNPQQVSFKPGFNLNNAHNQYGNGGVLGQQPNQVNMNMMNNNPYHNRNVQNGAIKQFPFLKNGPLPNAFNQQESMLRIPDNVDPTSAGEPIDPKSIYGLMNFKSKEIEDNNASENEEEDLEIQRKTKNLSKKTEKSKTEKTSTKSKAGSKQHFWTNTYSVGNAGGGKVSGYGKNAYGYGYSAGNTGAGKVSGYGADAYGYGYSAGSAGSGGVSGYGSDAYGYGYSAGSAGSGAVSGYGADAYGYGYGIGNAGSSNGHGSAGASGGIGFSASGGSVGGGYGTFGASGSIGLSGIGY